MFCFAHCTGILKRSQVLESLHSSNHTALIAILLLPVCLLAVFLPFQLAQETQVWKNQPFSFPSLLPQHPLGVVTLAANVDQVIAVAAPRPPLNAFTVDRYKMGAPCLYRIWSRHGVVTFWISLIHACPKRFGLFLLCWSLRSFVSIRPFLTNYVSSLIGKLFPVVCTTRVVVIWLQNSICPSAFTFCRCHFLLH